MAKHSISSGRRPCRPSRAKGHPNSHEKFTCVEEDFLEGERIMATIWPAGTPAATIGTPDGLILTPMPCPYLLRGGKSLESTFLMLILGTRKALLP